MGLSNLDLRSLRAAAHGSAYLLTQRSWMSRMGTGFRKCSFSRPRRRVTTSPASSSSLRCLAMPKRVISNRDPRAERVCPSSRNNSSSNSRRVGSARALNTRSMRPTIGDHLVTCQRFLFGFPSAGEGAPRATVTESFRGRTENSASLDSAIDGLGHPQSPPEDRLLAK